MLVPVYDIINCGPRHRYSANGKLVHNCDKINLQNLPSRGANANSIKKCMEVPEGHSAIDSDSSNIEARGVAWLAEQDDLVQAFAEGRDVYSSTASVIYGFEVNKHDNPDERFVGKECVLGSGYGMGWAKFQGVLKSKKNMAVSEEFARKVINTYRETYYKIPELWRCGEDALRWMASDQQGWLGREGVVFVDGLKGLRLPNGLYIQYTNLRRDEEGWVYDSGRKGVTRIYGAKLIENVTQALARIIVMWQLVQISRKYKVALTVHDAICIVVPDADRVEAEAFVSKIMRTAPKWAAGWPLDCEWGVGKSYGDC